MWSRRLKLNGTVSRCGRLGTGALRRLCVATQTVLLPQSSAALTHISRAFSSEEVLDEETQWTNAMANKYGAGNYQLFRPLYKDLCDEMRREYYTKPPPPPPVAAATKRRRHDGHDRNSSEEEDGGGTANSHGETAAAAKGANEPLEKSSSMAEQDRSDGGSVGASASGDSEAAADPELSHPHSPTPPEPTYGDGTWSVHYHPEHNALTFHCAAVKESRLAEIHAWSRIELKDPPRLNAVLAFADWTPIEICVERNGVMIHFSMASNEGGMHMRNVRVYAPASEEEKMALVDPSEDGERARKKLYYDGPCLWHLELRFQNELYDVMQDHGISLDWVHWAASWVFYAEHVNYVKWNLGLLEELIPSPLRGPESDFLSAAERALLDEPVEDWLEAHST
ncbi:putative mitochondrial hypothetical protein [Leptomonas pyrrhocoris]|uniref:Uncharacterized protein n=1 Tax=Leptomonas pyrrhocoris TaxID=157538 RepID=A0A0M9G327_LEPPY|nr:putative mitochondrial hypothetical protein [Leptomonas pyrrhocoris]KPA81410.1 putative mitochondrial hypothetical protein [Leptomonas pyrrhocoris]|eukprot:XP_015659849.1 putative mitochondrial hypothetical protein [Leptomonas pyrrhocoris]